MDMEILRKAGSCRFDRKERAGSTIPPTPMSIESSNIPTNRFYILNSQYLSSPSLVAGKQGHPAMRIMNARSGAQNYVS